MPKLIRSTPKYRCHKATMKAVVTLDGHVFYLGPWKSKASLVEYDRLIGEWIHNGRTLRSSGAASVTVSEVLVAYWRYAKGYYGTGTSTLEEIRRAVRPVKELYGRKLAAEFGPLNLKTVRSWMVSQGWNRGTVNKRAATIKRIFKWAVSEELAPSSVFHALQSVDGLRLGRTEAPESKPVRPVPDAVVDATLPHLPAVVADMVRVQRLTGARPSEICILRPADLDRTGNVWEYRPQRHKGAHLGKERVIFIGPQAQAVLTLYLLRPADACCFSPSESERKRRAKQHANRKTPLSCGNRPGSVRTPKPKWAPRDAYDRDTYRRAIQRACTKAKVELWSPNRLRHAAATEIRKRFGLEGAQVALGHASADVTQVYAERDQELARSIAAKIG